MLEGERKRGRKKGGKEREKEKGKERTLMQHWVVVTNVTDFCHIACELTDLLQRIIVISHGFTSSWLTKLKVNYSTSRCVLFWNNWNLEGIICVYQDILYCCLLIFSLFTKQMQFVHGDFPCSLPVIFMHSFLQNNEQVMSCFFPRLECHKMGVFFLDWMGEKKNLTSAVNIPRDQTSWGRIYKLLLKLFFLVLIQ